MFPNPWRLVFVLILSLFTANSVYATPPDAGHEFSAVPVDKPAKGVFLVANRDMSDLRFQRSVIILLLHGDEGSLGVIVNRPTDISLSEAVPDLPGAGNEEHTLFFGGPVAMETLLLLVRSHDPPAQAAPVLEEVYWSGSREALEALLAEGKPDSELRVYFGRAGWAPGQLEAELTDGSWRLFKADPETLFSQNPDGLWEAFMERLQKQWIMAQNHH